MILEDVENAPEIKRSTKICEEIMSGDTSHYRDLTFIPDNVAEVLRNSLDELYFDHIKSISDKTAEYLGGFKGKMIVLDKLENLSDASAKYLGWYEGSELSLKGLACISDATAKYLSRLGGVLSLTSLNTLSDASAKAFESYSGHLFLGNLEDLSEIARNSLLRNPRIIFSKKRSI